MLPSVHPTSNKNKEPHGCDSSLIRRLLIDIEAAAESLYLARRVNDALRAGVKRVAVRTYVNFNRRLGGVRLEGTSTRTLYG
jgi:hypothetical protein